MFVNRRLYRFLPEPMDPARGQLTVDARTLAARKTGKTTVSTLSLDTMTGRKNVIVYYDEFELEESHAIPPQK